MIKLEIDGQNVEAAPGSMVIQAADEAGVYIPRFCYHKKLSIAANCRMCLVQVGEGKKPMPACATPVAEGMKISTKSDVALKAQEAVMEFLLINHPLDCPICDQGGQCELQDLAMGYGRDHSRYTEPKRVVQDENLGPLIKTDMTRCIQCTRCVRFGKEVAGVQELGLLGRGEHEEIGVYVEEALKSEVSGNVIEVCPVGALVAKPSRYQARAWELQQKASLSPHDGVGSHLYVHTRRNEVIRVAPKENEALNEVWLSDRDRFSYEGLKSPDRIAQPQIKKDGVWQAVDWLTAFEYATEKLQKVLNHQGAEKITGLISHNATLEEQYLFQKLLRGVGVHSIDHRLQQVDLQTDIVTPELGMPIADLEKLKAIFLIGANVQKDQPVLGIRLRKAAKQGARLMSLQNSLYAQNLPVTDQLLTADVKQALKAIVKAAGAKHPALEFVAPTTAEKMIAKQLAENKEAAIVVGADLLNHPEASELLFWARLLSETTEKKLGYLALGANSVGAYLTNCLPEAKALDWQSAFEQRQAAYVLMGVEPEFDCARPSLAMQALKAADAVIVLNTFTTEAMRDYADVILPIAPFAENSGTLVNMEGTWQSFAAVVPPLNETRPAWKVLRVLAHFLKVEGMEYGDLKEVTEEVHRRCEEAKPTRQSRISKSSTILDCFVANPAPRNDGLYYVFSISTNRADPLVRRAAALQARPDNTAKVILNTPTAERLGHSTQSKLCFKQKDQTIQLPIEISNSIADNVALVFTGFAEFQHFDPHAPFEVNNVC